MNSLPVLHYPKDYNTLINSYYYALIPLLIFGFYKNGLLLYFNNLVNLKVIFIPLYYYLISIIIGLIIAKFFHEEAKPTILFALIITSTISLNSNLYMYPIILFISLFITKYLILKFKLKINITSLVRIMVLLSLLLNSYSYLNIAEKLNKFNYNLADIFIGHGVGGLANTSLLILLISLTILSLNKYYKKLIAYPSIITFIMLCLINIFIFKNQDFLSILCNGYIYFALIFIGTDLKTSPHHQKGMIIYGILMGILSFIFTLISKYEGIYFAIFLSSLFIPLINKFTDRKYLQV